MSTNLTLETMRTALQALDLELGQPVTLIMGGGGAMVLAYHHPLATADIDAIPKGIDIADLDRCVKKVAEKLSLSGDWLNPYFATFSHTLPEDYGDRLVEVMKGRFLTVLSLGKEDLLIMKCFAHRRKDVSHAKALIKMGTNVKFVESHIEMLNEKKIPKASAALDFLDDVVSQLED